MSVSLETMMADLPEDQRERIHRKAAEFAGAEIYRREFGWTAEDYALDRKLWPESYICPECGGEMMLKVSSSGADQQMMFTCACGYVKERRAAA